VRQPRALGLQGEEIDCLVKIPEQAELLQVRPMAPSGKPHKGPRVRVFGLPEPSAHEVTTRAVAPDAIATGPNTAAANPTAAAPPAPRANILIHYQRVFHLTPANLVPYAALTFPSLAPGTSALDRIQGELLGLSAMAAGVMVGFAIAERQADGGAQLISLKVDPLWRRRGIGTGLLQRLMVFLAREAIAPFSLRYNASPEISVCFEPILARLGWSQPRTDLLLLEGRSDQLAAIDWADRFAITSPYSLLPWEALTDEQRAQTAALVSPSELQPPADSQDLEPSISLALLHHNGPVGWLLAHRTGPGSVRYSSLFVAPGHRSRARGLALLSEGFRRQHAAAIATARSAIDGRHPAMLRLLQRHLGTHLIAIGRTRSSMAPLLQSAPLDEEPPQSAPGLQGEPPPIPEPPEPPPPEPSEPEPNPDP
jgi:GNAT superfamily N-acetyltransferase